WRSGIDELAELPDESWICRGGRVAGCGDGGWSAGSVRWRLMMRSVRFMGSVVMAAAAFAVLPRAASAQVPELLTQQGRLFDAGGEPVSGTVTLLFAIYSSPTGGTALWSEEQEVSLDEGFFSAQIGDVVPLPAGLFDGSVRYLGVTVGDDPEMTPRQPLVSVPYALTANNATGDITPTSITVNGVPVIDEDGNWVGPTDGCDVDDIRQCRRYYGDEKVTDALLQAKYLPLHTIHFASAVIDKPLNEFRCYILRQLDPGLFPY
ncbi:MAG: hypothetical protein R6W81_15465, partial [Bacteroidales bacterium]